jgi:hypothetical protein
MYRVTNYPLCCPIIEWLHYYTLRATLSDFVSSVINKNTLM